MFSFLIFVTVMRFISLVGSVVNMAADGSADGPHILAFLINLLTVIWGCVLLF